MNTKNVEEGKSGIKGVNELTKAFEAMFADGVTAGGENKFLLAIKRFSFRFHEVIFE